MHACMHAQSCLTFRDLWPIACQSLLSMEFSRQEYWSGLPFPSLGIFPTQGLNPDLLCLLPWQRDINGPEFPMLGSAVRGIK